MASIPASRYLLWAFLCPVLAAAADKCPIIIRPTSLYSKRTLDFTKGDLGSEEIITRQATLQFKGAHVVAISGYLCEDAIADNGERLFGQDRVLLDLTESGHYRHEHYIDDWYNPSESPATESHNISIMLGV